MRYETKYTGRGETEGCTECGWQGNRKGQAKGHPSHHTQQDPSTAQYTHNAPVRQHVVLRRVLPPPPCQPPSVAACGATTQTPAAHTQHATCRSSMCVCVCIFCW